MRDKTHMDQVERWAHFVKEHPTEWKAIHTEFINAVYEKAYDSIEKIRRQPDGKNKIIKIFNIKNKNCFK